MQIEEFSMFMKLQFAETESYVAYKKIFCPELFENQFAFEWIDKYSDEFRIS